MNIKLLLFLLVTFLLKSCGNTNAIASKHGNTIQNFSGNYNIITLGEKDVSNYKLDLIFHEGKNHVSGFSGCNRFSGSYNIENNKITFGPLASTKMFCEEEANKMEHQVFEALSETNSFLFENNILKLLKGETVLLTAEQDNSYIIEYTAQARGFFQQIIISKKIVSIQKDMDSKPITKPCEKTDWDKISLILKDINVKSFPNLEIPSKAHQYDGAAIATLKINHQGKDYKTQSFDHGNPPKEVKALIEEILSISQKIE